MKVIKCCKDCETRHLGCHAVCEDYLAEKAELDAEREKVFAEKQKLMDSDSCDVRRSIRAKKYLGKRK